MVSKPTKATDKDSKSKGGNGKKDKHKEAAQSSIQR